MKSTKKALFLAIVSTLLCVVMLAGTTFAWFTDTVESGKNKIVSGNLDVDFEYSKDMSEWKTVKGTTDLFSDVALWEPGSCSVVYLKVTNKGSLAVKYNVAVTVDSEIAGTNVNGDAFKLSDYIKFGQVEDVTAKYATREEAINVVSSSAKAIGEGYAFASTMKAGDDAKTFALIVYMPETLGNEVNYKTGTTAPSIELGAVLQAAQLNYETDSYDKDYDKAAVLPWIGLMATAEEFAENVDTENKEIEIWDAENLAYWSQNVKNYHNYTVKLMADIDLGGALWTPVYSFNDQPSGVGTNFVLDGNGHKIMNLTVSKTGDGAGFINTVTGVVTIKNLTFTNPSVSSNGKFIGTVIGYQYGHVTLDNVDVVGGSVKGLNYTPEYTDKSIRVGGLVGFSALDDTGVSLTLKDCDVDGVTLQGYHTTCGLVGTLKDYTARDNWSIANCSVKNCKLVIGTQEDKHFSEITVDGTAYPSVEDNLANFNGKVVTENNTVSKLASNQPTIASIFEAMSKTIEAGVTTDPSKLPAEITVASPILLAPTPVQVGDTTENLAPEIDGATTTMILNDTLSIGNTYVDMDTWGGLRVQGQGGRFSDVTFKGNENGKFTSVGSNVASLVYIEGNSKVTFESGTFETDCRIICYGQMGGGTSTVEIKGGTFKFDGADKDHQAQFNKSGTSGLGFVAIGNDGLTITVTGGTFYNCDPTSYVASGYHVENNTVGNDIIYTVVAD